MRKLFSIAALLVAFALPALAENGPIEVTGAWSRPTAPEAPTAAVYLSIVNHGTVDDTLTGIATPVAASAMLHQTSNENGIMSMSMVKDLQVKAGDTVSVKPGALHIMLMGMKQQLKPGDSFAITLTFAHAGPVQAKVTVETKAPAEAKPTHGMKNMGDMKM